MGATLYADLTCKTKFTQGGHNSTQTMPAPGYKLKACERSSHFKDLNGTKLWKSQLCTQIDPKINRNPITAAKKCGVAINTKPCKGGYMASTAIESTVQLKGISAAQFGESEKAAFVAGVAKTAGVAETQVNILSVKDSARRASGVEVTSSITVAAATSADAEKLSAKINTALKNTTSLQKNIQASSAGTSLSGTTTSASMAKTTSTSSGIAASSSSSSSTDVGMIAGVVVAVVVVVAVLIVGGYFCSQKKKSNDGVTVKVDDQGRI